MSAAVTTELDALSIRPTLQTFFGNLDSFADVPEGVAKLRELILDLAVRGKLVEQDENDEPASVLLAECLENEKTRGKTANDPFDTDPPFALPATWEWVRFDQIVDFEIGKTPSTKAPQYWDDGGIPWVSIADMPSTGFIEGTKKSVTKEAADQVFKHRLSQKGRS